MLINRINTPPQKVDGRDDFDQRAPHSSMEWEGGQGEGAHQGIPPQRRNKIGNLYPPPQGTSTDLDNARATVSRGDREGRREGKGGRATRPDLMGHGERKTGKARPTEAPCRSVPQPLAHIGPSLKKCGRGDQGLPPLRQ